METLHESMIATKTAEYIMAFAFLVLFTLFWRFVYRQPRNR